MDELKKGIEHEREHDSVLKAIAADAKAGKLKPLVSYTKMIAKDHLKEISDYYTRLTKMESKAKGVKAEQEEDDERAEKAFKTWNPTATALGDSPIVESSHEPYFPTVSIEMESAPEYNIGDEVEVEFKACVIGISKRDKKVSIEFRLKEFKTE